MSEETKSWIRRRRKRIGITSLVAILTLLVLTIGERNSLMDQIDWIVNALHGPSDIKSIKAQVYRTQKNLSDFEMTTSNQLYDIKQYVREVDEKLSMPAITRLTRTNRFTLASP